HSHFFDLAHSRQAGHFLLGMKSACRNRRQGPARRQRKEIAPALGNEANQSPGQGQKAATGRPVHTTAVARDGYRSPAIQRNGLSSNGAVARELAPRRN